MAREGLRTLVYGRKQLTERQYAGVCVYVRLVGDLYLLLRSSMLMSGACVYARVRVYLQRLHSATRRPRRVLLTAQRLCVHEH